MTQEKESPTVIYEDADKTVEVRLDADQKAIWLMQVQMAELFDVNPQNITKHLENIYAEKELVEEGACKDFLQTQREAGREVKHEHDRRDAVISMGHRICAARPTKNR